MKKRFNYILMFIFAFILGGSALAASQYFANQISFNSNNSNWEVSTVQEAIEDLYDINNNGKNNLISSLQEKGVNINSDASYSDIVSGINNLDNNKSYYEKVFVETTGPLTSLKTTTFTANEEGYYLFFMLLSGGTHTFSYETTSNDCNYDSGVLVPEVNSYHQVLACKMKKNDTFSYSRNCGNNSTYATLFMVGKIKGNSVTLNNKVTNIESTTSTCNLSQKGFILGYSVSNNSPVLIFPNSNNFTSTIYAKESVKYIYAGVTSIDDGEVGSIIANSDGAYGRSGCFAFNIA